MSLFTLSPKKRQKVQIPSRRGSPLPRQQAGFPSCHVGMPAHDTIERPVFRHNKRGDFLSRSVFRPVNRASRQKHVIAILAWWCDVSNDYFFLLDYLIEPKHDFCPPEVSVLQRVYVTYILPHFHRGCTTNHALRQK